jgi:site-specific DNA-cytosine methylase
MELKPEQIPFKPDVIWASPPCTTFSVASIHHYWDKGKPKNDVCLKGIALVKKTIELIQQLDPILYFIENPRGMLRKQDFMQSLKRDTVTYCQYGHCSQKPTDIWNNCKQWKPKPCCKPGASCHEKASRGAKTGIQGIYNKNDYMPKHRSPVLRAIVPKLLCEEIIKVCEETKG